MIKLILLTLLSTSIMAFNLDTEIAELNKEFNNYEEYPIIIFNKNEIKQLVKNKGHKDQVTLIKNHLFTRYNLKINKYEADTILTYHTDLDSSASALPFKGTDNKTYRFCAVFPSGSDNNHIQEVERSLGITPGQNPYPIQTTTQISEKLSLKELKLISLYHELSHCLDRKYIPNVMDPSSHDIHEAESFAETMALLLLQERKGFHNMPLNRSLHRTMYSKYMGKFLATDEDLIVFDPIIRDGGIVYFLSPVILATQKLINDFDYRTSNKDLDSMIKNAEEIVYYNSISARDFAALRIYFKEGREAAINQYKGMAVNSPDYFLMTYKNLKTYIDLIEEVDLFL